jgi:hypothetical protein
LADHQPFAEVDVSDWQNLGPEPIGSKPNLWLEDEHGERWLFKERKRQNTANPYWAGDDWAERIATATAQLLGIPVADVEFARFEDRLGTISKSVVAGAEVLTNGNEVLQGHIENYPFDRKGVHDEYTVAAVLGSLQGTVAPGGLQIGDSATDCFAAYLVLDAVVGNCDRHHLNWAVISAPGQDRRLSPSFDHGSSMGFQLSDAQRAAILDTADQNANVPAFVKRARSKWSGAPHPVDVAVLGLDTVKPETRQAWLMTLANRRGDIADLPTLVPQSRIAPEAREFASRLLDVTLTLILD